MKTALVTAANDAYYGLLLDLIHSWRACPESAGCDICVLDIGLTSDQIAALTPQVTRIVAPPWDLEFDHSTCPTWFKAMVARPHLPKHFPNYDLLIWIDADAWLSNGDALRLLIHGGTHFGFVIVPEIDRTYSHCYHLHPGVTAVVHKTYLDGFGQEIADRLTPMPIINSGVFSMRTDSRDWQIWSSVLHGALQRSTGALIEQCALNAAIYDRKIQPHFLPSWCNWNCAMSLPILNVATRSLHCPMLPHERISICHLTDLKLKPVNLPCADGTIRKTPLTYRAIHGGNPSASH